MECPISLGTQKTLKASAISHPHLVAFPTCPMDAELQGLENSVCHQEYEYDMKYLEWHSENHKF